ncbi:MAG: hypothetical protein MPJ24_09780 [Pirellulaceae bacterium]|nr:hypothetical protein [Pirellulaceae bacterium]
MSDSDRTQLILSRFKLLPSQFKGEAVEFTLINNDNFSAVDAELCRALEQPIGNTVSDCFEITGCGSWYIYASGETARKLINVNKYSKIQVTATTIFGILSSTEWADHHPRETKSTELGLLIESFEVLED